jgi:ComF family protein
MFEITIDGTEETCSYCLDNAKFYDMARSLFQYNELSRRLIMKIKKHSDHITASACVKMLYMRYRDILETYDIVVPVPSHWTRLLRRGYNPANIIAVELAKISGKGYGNVLRRCKKTEYQRGKSTLERANNVLDAFTCKTDLSSKSIALVDDVMTTGATLNECARVLKHSGAKKVICITIACTRAF